jgi:4'-phosphopantetheinyl transferase
VHFNISHSRDRLLIAVSNSGPVGVDIEHLRPIDAAWLARNWFSRTERREWAGVAAASRLEAFFHGWTRKEAFLKATGFGMAMPLDSFSVSLNPCHAELLEVRGEAPRRWRLSGIDAGPECVAAVVTSGDPGTIRVRRAA